jgi:hypothetical protein
MHAAPQIMHPPVHPRQAKTPSTRTGSTGGLPHIGHSSSFDVDRLARLMTAALVAGTASEAKSAQFNDADGTF